MSTVRSECPRCGCLVRYTLTLDAAMACRWVLFSKFEDDEWVQQATSALLESLEDVFAEQSGVLLSK